ncbi:cytochrome c oxidase subunit II [Spongisporangium articulatum]|uniref:cytochrome-c oxidase n=1 Tax=Spongisporangium articulatum TaxID=3362603 RepID=A0ABW8ASX7_9ACTN
MGRPELRSHSRTPSPRRTARAATLALGVGAVLTLSGCSDTLKHGFLPYGPDVAVDNDRIINLWNGSWIAALVVGVLVWGLIIWSVVVYRRRRDDAVLPPQVRYHLPLEIMYTIVPLMMVGVLFFYTARDQSELLSLEKTPDLTVGVVAKQWSWDFNYVNADVYETGVMGELDGGKGIEKELPTLWLPVNKRVQFNLTSRDVIHSFWIPAFLRKMDTIPGVENSFQVVPTQIGTYKGKCAELCGEYHSAMLFNVKVVSQADYDAHVAALRAAGQTGSLPTDLGRSKLPVDPGHAEEAGVNQ